MLFRSSEVTISALTPANVYELAHESLGPVIDVNPEASRELRQSLARWQTVGTMNSDVVSTPETATTSQIGSWLAKHFHQSGVSGEA